MMNKWIIGIRISVFAHIESSLQLIFDSNWSLKAVKSGTLPDSSTWPNQAGIGRFVSNIDLSSTKLNRNSTMSVQLLSSLMVRFVLQPSQTKAASTLGMFPLTILLNFSFPSKPYNR